MSKCFIIAYFVLHINCIYSQNIIKDTIYFKNSFFFSEEKISDSLKTIYKQRDVKIVVPEQLTNSVFIVKNKIYPLSQFEEISQQYKSREKVFLLTESNEINNYVVSHNLIKLVTDSILSTNKKLVIIVDIL